MKNLTIPAFITFTGIDDRTDLTRADNLARIYPVEWGVLFSSSNRDARYPCMQAVKEILSITGRKAAHLCGKMARQVGHAAVPPDVPIAFFDRVQINGNFADDQAFWHVKNSYGIDVVRQVRGERFDRECPFLQLFDRSGGEGVRPDQVPELPGDHMFVGYAGGMGPDSVLEYLEQIEGAGRFWIDMESNVRTNGWFDLDKVERVCELVFGDK